MNTTIMLTYYYDDPSDYHDNSSSMTNATRVTTEGAGEESLTTEGIHNRLALRDHASNPALVHHLYLGLSHMGKVRQSGRCDNIVLDNVARKDISRFPEDPFS